MQTFLGESSAALGLVAVFIGICVLARCAAKRQQREQVADQAAMLLPLEKGEELVLP